MTSPRLAGRSFAIAIAFVLAFVVTHAAAPRPATPPRLDALPMVLAGWPGVAAPPLDAETARVLAADQYVHRFYQTDAATVEMDVAYYTQPHVGASMHSPLNCLPGNGWAVSGLEALPVITSAGVWNVESLIVQRGRARYAMVYWFQTRQGVIGSELRTRLSLVGDALARRPTDAGIVRLMTPITDGRSEQALLAVFASQLIPKISGALE